MRPLTIWGIGLLAVATIWVMAVRDRIPSIQADLTLRARDVARTLAHDDVLVSADGQRLLVSGRVPDRPGKVRLLKRLAQLRGVTDVVDELRIGAPPTTTPRQPTMLTLTLESSETGSLRGQVDSEESRRTILDTARQLFPDAEFDDQLLVAPNVAPAGEEFADVVMLGMESLLDLDRGRLHITPRTLELRGAHEDFAHALRLEERLGGANLDGRDLIVDIDAPAADAAGCQALFNEMLSAATIKFHSASALLDLDADNESLLLRIAEVIGECGFQVEIAGHTDNEGDADSNMRLSEARANAVRRYLIEQGTPDHLIDVTGYGETSPIADNNTVEGRRQNRRIEITVRSAAS